MPSNLLTADTGFPNLGGMQPAEQISALTDYLYMLLEQLRYTLSNLGESNFNETSLQSIEDRISQPLSARITDTQGNVNTLQLVADALAVNLKNAEGSITALQVTTDGIATRVQSAEGNISSLTQNENALTARVDSAERGLSATLQLTADGLTVTDAEGNRVGFAGNRAEFYDIAFGALKDGDRALYMQIAKELMGRGVKASSLESAMKDREKEEKKENPDFSLGKQAEATIGPVFKYQEDEEDDTFTYDDLAPDQYEKFVTEKKDVYLQVSDTVKNYDLFDGLDMKTRDKILGNILKLAKTTSLEHNSDGQFVDDTKWIDWALGGSGSGVDTAEAILFKTAYDNTKADLNENGAPINGSKKKNTLELVRAWMPELTEGELRYLKSNYWKE